MTAFISIGRLFKSRWITDSPATDWVRCKNPAQTGPDKLLFLKINPDGLSTIHFSGSRVRVKMLTVFLTIPINGIISRRFPTSGTFPTSGIVTAIYKISGPPCSILFWQWIFSDVVRRIGHLFLEINYIDHFYKNKENIP